MSKEVGSDLSEAGSLFELFYRKTAPLHAVPIAITEFSKVLDKAVLLKNEKSSYEKIRSGLHFRHGISHEILCLFFSVQFFKSRRSLVRQGLMGTNMVVKVDICFHAFSEFRFRRIFMAVDFFSFKCRDERFRHRIVMRASRF